MSGTCSSFLARHPHLKSLEKRYLERFPECSADIARGIEQATDRFGEPLFGRQAWTTLMALWDALPGAGWRRR